MCDRRLPQRSSALRLTPLNRVASLKLKVAGLTEKPAVLPVFQLMTWGLVHCSCLDYMETASALRNLVRRSDQQEALDALLAGVPGGTTAFQHKLLRLPPRAAAWALLGVFDRHLKQGIPQPRPEDRT